MARKHFTTENTEDTEAKKIKELRALRVSVVKSGLRIVPAAYSMQRSAIHHPAVKSRDVNLDSFARRSLDGWDEEKSTRKVGARQRNWPALLFAELRVQL